MKKYNSIIKTLVVIFTIAYIAVIIALIALLAKHYIDWATAVFTFVSCTVELILLYALNNALARVSALENRIDKPKKMADDDADGIPDEVLQYYVLGKETTTDGESGQAAE